MIKMDVKKYPIYGADINSGKIEIFHTSEDAVAFLTKSTDNERGEIRLQQPNSEALIPYYLISSTSSEEVKSDLIVSCKI